MNYNNNNYYNNIETKKDNETSVNELDDLINDNSNRNIKGQPQLSNNLNNNNNNNMFQVQSHQTTEEKKKKDEFDDFDELEIDNIDSSQNHQI